MESFEATAGDYISVGYAFKAIGLHAAATIYTNNFVATFPVSC